MFGSLRKGTLFTIGITPEIAAQVKAGNYMVHVVGKTVPVTIHHYGKSTYAPYFSRKGFVPMAAQKAGPSRAPVAGHDFPPLSQGASKQITSAPYQDQNPRPIGRGRGHQYKQPGPAPGYKQPWARPLQNQGPPRPSGSSVWASNQPRQPPPGAAEGYGYQSIKGKGPGKGASRSSTFLTGDQLREAKEMYIRSLLEKQARESNEEDIPTDKPAPRGGPNTGPGRGRGEGQHPSGSG